MKSSPNYHYANDLKGIKGGCKMINKKAQEISPGGFLMGVIGAIAAFVMAKSMSGIVMAVIVAIITGIVCYFMASAILNK